MRVYALVIFFFLSIYLKHAQLIMLFGINEILCLNSSCIHFNFGCLFEILFQANGCLDAYISSIQLFHSHFVAFCVRLNRIRRFVRACVCVSIFFFLFNSRFNLDDFICGITYKIFKYSFYF